MPRRKRKSRCRSGEAPRTARRWEIKGSSARTAHRKLTLTFTAVGHLNCAPGTASGGFGAHQSAAPAHPGAAVHRERIPLTATPVIRRPARQAI